MKVVIPGLRLHNPLNGRVHWRVLSKRGRLAKAETAEALLLANDAGLTAPTVERPWVATITRLGPGSMDCDNLGAAAKHVRDSIAAWCGVDDRHRHIVLYKYKQRREKEYGVEIHIEQLEGPHELAD